MTWLATLLQAILVWVSGYFKARQDEKLDQIKRERTDIDLAIQTNTLAANLTLDELQQRSLARKRSIPKVYSVPSVSKGGLANE